MRAVMVEYASGGIVRGPRPLGDDSVPSAIGGCLGGTAPMADWVCRACRKGHCDECEDDSCACSHGDEDRDAETPAVSL